MITYHVLNFFQVLWTWNYFAVKSRYLKYVPTILRMRIKLFKLYTVYASFCTFSIRMSLFLSAGKPTPLSWLTYEVWIWVNSPMLALGLRRMVSQFSPTYLSRSTTLLLLLCMLPLWRHKIANILLLFMERSSDVDWTVYEFCGKMWYFISLKIFLELFTLSL